MIGLVSCILRATERAAEPPDANRPDKTELKGKLDLEIKIYPI